MQSLILHTGIVVLLDVRWSSPVNFSPLQPLQCASNRAVPPSPVDFKHLFSQGTQRAAWRCDKRVRLRKSVASPASPIVYWWSQDIEALPHYNQVLMLQNLSFSIQQSVWLHNAYWSFRLKGRNTGNLDVLSDLMGQNPRCRYAQYEHCRGHYSSSLLSLFYWMNMIQSTLNGSK